MEVLSKNVGPLSVGERTEGIRRRSSQVDPLGHSGHYLTIPRKRQSRFDALHRPLLDLNAQEFIKEHTFEPADGHRRR